MKLLGFGRVGDAELHKERRCSDCRSPLDTAKNIHAAPHPSIIGLEPRNDGRPLQKEIADDGIIAADCGFVATIPSSATPREAVANAPSSRDAMSRPLALPYFITG